MTTSSVAPPALVGLGAFCLTLSIGTTLSLGPTIGRVPPSLSITATSDVVPGSYLDTAALAAGRTVDSSAPRPGCPATDATGAGLPAACAIHTGPVSAHLHIHAVEPTDKHSITLESARTLIAGPDPQPAGAGGLVTASIDRVTIDRETKQPSSDATALLSFVPADVAAPAPFSRDGLAYAFPAHPPKDGLRYFDPDLAAPEPLTYVGDSYLAGVDVEVYRERVGPVDQWAALRDFFAATGQQDVAAKVLGDYRVTDVPAGRWGLPGDPSRAVDAHRFHTVDRSFYVEPTTGQVIDEQQDVFDFFDESLPAAQAFFGNKEAVHAERTAPTRTALSYTTRWSVQSSLDAAERAQRTKDEMTTAGRIVPAALAVAGLLALAAGFRLGVRRRPTPPSSPRR